MALTDIRKNVTDSTPLLAVVGVTDYALQRVREVAANAASLQQEVERTLSALEGVPATVQARVQKLDAKSVQQVPALAVARALEAAGKVEASYEGFALRGKQVLGSVSRQQATQDLLKQGKITVSRTRAAVTTARKAVDETAAAALNVVIVGRREAGDVAADVEKSVAATEKVVAQRTATKQAAKTATATARRRTGSARTAVKAAGTSARKTAAKATEAVEASANKIGKERSDTE